MIYDICRLYDICAAIKSKRKAIYGASPFAVYLWPLLTSSGPDCSSSGTSRASVRDSLRGSSQSCGRPRGLPGSDGEGGACWAKPRPGQKYLNIFEIFLYFEILQAPAHSPTMAGGLFSIDKQFSEKLGAYDPGFDIWGWIQRNIEILIIIIVE